MKKRGLEIRRYQQDKDELDLMLISTHLRKVNSVFSDFASLVTGTF